MATSLQQTTTTKEGRLTALPLTFDGLYPTGRLTMGWVEMETKEMIIREMREIRRKLKEL